MSWGKEDSSIYIGNGNCTSACCNYTGGCSGCLTCNPLPTATPVRQGWECPRCHAVYAPWVFQCTACSASYPFKPTFDYGTGSITPNQNLRQFTVWG